jgi:CshA-type fibril repeat protein
MIQAKIYFIFSLIFFTLTTLQAEPLRIMPLGDSITYDNNHADDEGNPRPIAARIAYRGPLWSLLRDVNMSFDFVGPKKAGQNYHPDFDPDNAGYPGETSKQIAAKTYSLLQDYSPQTILLHIGTNDHSDNVGYVNEILNWVDTYEGDTNQEIHVIVALILDKTIHDLHIEGFNKNLEKLIKNRWENGDKVTLVDMYRGAGLTDADYADVTHPNANGYAKMARVWFNALRTPFVAYTSAPIPKDDKINTQTGSTVTINVTLNDKDSQNDINRSSVSFLGGSDSDGDGDNDILSVSGEGKWSVDSYGVVTFTPIKGFTADPTPARYTLKDEKDNLSDTAQIIINYTNDSLENFPTTLVEESYIESKSVNEATNTIEFITRVPNNGITF